MKSYTLSDSDDGVAIFTSSAEREIRKLDATQSRNALTAIINCLESPAPESVIEKPYATCRALEQLRQGGLRIYVSLVTSVPGYDVLWVFAVRKHRYRNLGKFDVEACRKVTDLRECTTHDHVEQFLATNDALTLADLVELRSQL